MKGNVNNVQTDGKGGGGDQLPDDTSSTTGSTATRRTSITSATSQSSSTGTKSVRRVRMCHVATLPAEQPEIFVTICQDFYLDEPERI